MPEVTATTAHRAIDHPRRRWSDDIRKYVAKQSGDDTIDWMDAGENECNWYAWEEEFVNGSDMQ